MNNQSFPTTKAERLILDKLEIIEKKIAQLLEERTFESIEEISLYKASKILHCGTDKLLSFVSKGELKAITYKDKNNKIRYRFRTADIRDYQKRIINRNIEDSFEIESSESIAKRIFNINHASKKMVQHECK